MAHLKLSTVAQMERFVAAGGRLLGMIFLPGQAFGSTGTVDIGDRMERLFGVNPAQSQAERVRSAAITVLEQTHPNGGRAAFLRGYALARQLPWRLQEALGTPGHPESPYYVIESAGDATRYFFAPPTGERQEITAEVQAERAEVTATLGRALNGLLAPDIVLDNPELFCLHRAKDGHDLYFVVNPTHQAQSTAGALPGAHRLEIWDPATGDQRPLAPTTRQEGTTHFRLTLPPVGSCFVVATPATEPQIVATNLVIERQAEGEIQGYGATEQAYVEIDDASGRIRLTAAGQPPAPSLPLDGEWEFVAEDANALVLGRWLALAETPGRAPATYARPDAGTTDWLPMTPGAWSYQLPAEPAQPYPIPVWFRAVFQADYVPPRLDLVVDGFAGSAWQLYVNGSPVTVTPVRSAIDSQMQAVDITEHVHFGANTVALRLALTSAVDGLLDLLKLTGDFSLAARGDGGHTLVAPNRRLQPAPWTEQGYPFYSGRGVYRRRFQLPPEYAGRRVFVQISMQDDVLEVVVNGHCAGVCLWDPYTVEIGHWLQPGENMLELRVANTLINLLEGVARPSGLAGVPVLAAYQEFTFSVPC
jgi:hypothetical protein